MSELDVLPRRVAHDIEQPAFTRLHVGRDAEATDLTIVLPDQTREGWEAPSTLATKASGAQRLAPTSGELDGAIDVDHLLGSAARREVPTGRIELPTLA